MQPLHGQHIFVTGGAKDIGASIVKEAAEQGARVSFVDSDASAGEQLVSELKSFNLNVFFSRADVGTFKSLEAAHKSGIEEFGEIHGVVNSAGVDTHSYPVSMSESEWEEVFDNELKSIWFTAKLALPAMKAAKKGAIVNIGSIHGRATSKNYFPIGAVKSAIIGITRNLAIDQGINGIRTNCISAGDVMTSGLQKWLEQVPGRLEHKTEVQPRGTFGAPIEIAKVACFLLSDDASFVNGADWPVDGALSARIA
jgi:NAD(P)-dependent dehydrogenase (short-subunit alcohol dehydrogenase family)